MQLIKSELADKDSGPRWVYKDGSVYIKIIPYNMCVDHQLETQIKLINSVMNMSFITHAEVIELDETWDNSNRNDYVKYTMQELTGPIAQGDWYRNIDILLEKIAKIYIAYNIKLYPHAQFDMSLGNMLGNKLLDWDNVILGHCYSTKEIAVQFIEHMISSHSRFIENSFVPVSTLDKVCNWYNAITKDTLLQCRLDYELILEKCKNADLIR